MGIASNHKKYTKFHLRLFWSVTAAFVFMSVCFVGFEYYQQKQFKILQLDSKLTGYNDYINGEMQKGLSYDKVVINDAFRISIIDTSGKLLYDSRKSDVSEVENHLSRKEIKDALRNGHGFDVRRKSTVTPDTYFYSAKRFGNYIIRSAIPYNTGLVESLKVNPMYIVLMVVFLLVFAIIFFSYMHRLGENINKLKAFADIADTGDIDEFNGRFQNDEVGEISGHIVQIYNNLQKTKEALMVEQARVLEQKEEQARIKRQLTQNIAHELKTPVSSLQGFLETIIANPDLPREKVSDFINKIYSQSTRLASLLRDISTLTRIDEAPEMISRENIELSGLIESVIEDVSVHVKEKNIKIHNFTQSMTLACTGNHSLIYSIFRNLLDNSIAYSECTDIYIRCNMEDLDYYYFSFSDNGIGIGEEHLTRIFERFYRVDKGRSRKAGGTGLGLSIVKNAVLFHGGTISARKRVGGGVEFLFTIRRR
ncbi:MAG: ATP-binding protein [Bacteroidales bacterium]|jgi:signal transduction histidine kinase|nr:ATP-binding protein [Bacteroidales bacterium]